jgi:hypothetical protein
MYLSVIHLTTLSEAHKKQRRMIRRLVNNEMENMWKKAVVV